MHGEREDRRRDEQQSRDDRRAINRMAECRGRLDALREAADTAPGAGEPRSSNKRQGDQRRDAHLQQDQRQGTGEIHLDPQRRILQTSSVARSGPPPSVSTMAKE